MENTEIFGQRIKAISEAKGLKAKDLALLLGVSEKTVYNIFKTGKVKAYQAMSIANALGVEFSELISTDTKPKRIEELAKGYTPLQTDKSERLQRKIKFLEEEIKFKDQMIRRLLEQ